MARDDPRIARLYGDRGSRQPGPSGPRYGIVPALWVLGLWALGLGAAVLAVVALILALRRPPVEEQLHAWGILRPDEQVWLYHDHSARGDGSSGCVATVERVVRWDQRQVSGAVELPGADIDVDRATGVQVVVRQGERALDCPFEIGGDAQGFADALRLGAARQQREPWGPERDPRLR